MKNKIGKQPVNWWKSRFFPYKGEKSLYKAKLSQFKLGVFVLHDIMTNYELKLLTIELNNKDDGFIRYEDIVDKDFGPGSSLLESIEKKY